MSGCVALRPRLPGGIVTWFVTGFRTSFDWCLVSQNPYRQPSPWIWSRRKGHSDSRDRRAYAGSRSPAADVKSH